MASQLDLDQGGTFRQRQRLYMGPSVGWVDAPQDAILPITATGTYTIFRGTNLITINVNASVTINLPSSKASPQGPQAIPGQWVLVPVVIADIGGFATSLPGPPVYLINPFGTEKISGLSSVHLTSPWGSLVLQPILATGGWTLTQ